MAANIHAYDKSSLRAYALQRFSNEAVAEEFEKLYRIIAK
jgi:hypothetical protein